MAITYENVQLPDTYVLDPNEGWNAGAISIGLLDGDATYKFQVDGTPAGVVTGLSDPASDTGYSYQEIEWAFYISNGGYRVMENGVDKTPPVASAPTTTVYKIRRVGLEVTYWVDDVLVYTSLNTPSSESSFLLVDASLYAAGDNIADAVIYDVATLTANFTASMTGAATTTLTNSLTASFSADFSIGAFVNKDGTYILGAGFDAAISTSGLLNKTKQITAGFSFVTSSTGLMSALHNDGSNVSFEALASWATDHQASTSSATFEEIVSDSNGGLVVPTVASSGASLAGIVTKSHVLTGEVATANTAVLEPLDVLSADHNYAESAASIFGFTSRSGEYQIVDGVFQYTIPSTDFKVQSSAFEQDLQGVTADVPAVTMIAFSGNGADLSVPASSLIASGTVEGVGRLNAVSPVVSIVASGTTGGIAQVDQSVSFDLSLVSYSGGYAKLNIPKSSVSSTGLVGVSASAVMAAPLVSLTANVVSENFGSAVLSVPEVTSIFGQAILDVPATYITATIVQVPSAYASYAMNVANNAVSSYTNYQFDHLLRFNGVYYGILGNIMFSLDGDTDNTTPIASSVEIAPSDFGSAKLKRCVYSYVSGRADQTLSVQPKADEKLVGTYTAQALDRIGTHTRRITLPRGAKGRYWGLTISNTEGDALDIDSVEYKVETLTRKV